MSYQELVDVHACIDGNLPSEVIVYFLFTTASGSMVSQQLCKILQVGDTR